MAQNDNRDGEGSATPVGLESLLEDLSGLTEESTRNELVRELLRLSVLEGAAADLGLEPQPEDLPRDILGRPFEGSPESYGAPLLRAAAGIRQLGANLLQDRIRSEGTVEELLALPQARRRVAVCEDPRLQTLSLCEDLLDLSWDAGFDRPAEAVELAELAVSVAAELGSGSLPARLLNDYKARSWATLGNARRISSDLRGAEQAFELAESFIERGTGDPLEEGRLCELEASLSRDSRRLDEAESLLRRAGRLYRRCESQHNQGRVLISQGLLAGRKDEPESAIRLIRRGREKIDPASEPRLTLVATHNLAFYLSEIGKADEALKVLSEARLMHRSFDNRMDLTRLRWLEGRVALAADRVEEAEAAFTETRESFIQQEIGYDMALVSLDLVGVYARQGRAAEMRALAEEMIPIFQSRDLGREVMASLIVLQNATRIESVSAKLIEELSALLQASCAGPDEPLDP